MKQLPGNMNLSPWAPLSWCCGHCLPSLPLSTAVDVSAQAEGPLAPAASAVRGDLAPSLGLTSRRHRFLWGPALAACVCVHAVFLSLHLRAQHSESHRLSEETRGAEHRASMLWKSEERSGFPGGRALGLPSFCG